MVSHVFADGCPTKAALRRMRLRHAALTYARHGWQVLAGSRLCGRRFKCSPGCATVSCHPLHAPVDAGETHEIQPTRDSRLIADRWRRVPHSVLLATGHAFDVVEVPADIGAIAAAQLSGPVAVTPTGQWMFLVRPGEPLHPELSQHNGVVLHGIGSWIPAPPVRTPEGFVRWVVAPHETDWRIPEARSVQSMLAGTLPWMGYPGTSLPTAA